MHERLVVPTDESEPAARAVDERDPVVTGSHGRSGVRRMPLGRVAKRVPGSTRRSVSAVDKREDE